MKRIYALLGGLALLLGLLVPGTAQAEDEPPDPTAMAIQLDLGPDGISCLVDGGLPPVTYPKFPGVGVKVKGYMECTELPDFMVFRVWAEYRHDSTKPWKKVGNAVQTFVPRTQWNLTATATCASGEWRGAAFLSASKGPYEDSATSYSSLPNLHTNCPR